jgi:hypothetical protein
LECTWAFSAWRCGRPDGERGRPAVAGLSWQDTELTEAGTITIRETLPSARRDERAFQLLRRSLTCLAAAAKSLSLFIG